MKWTGRKCHQTLKEALSEDLLLLRSYPFSQLGDDIEYNCVWGRGEAHQKRGRGMITAREVPTEVDSDSHHSNRIDTRNGGKAPEKPWKLKKKKATQGGKDHTRVKSWL